MAVYIYNSGFVLTTPHKGSNKQLATRGVFPGHLPISVATDGVLTLPVAIPTDITFGGSALLSARVEILPAGQLILDSSVESPVSAILSGQQEHTYGPVGELNLSGDGLVQFNKSTGEIEFVYVASPQPLELSGSSSDTEIVMNYIAGGSVTFAGDTSDAISIARSYLMQGGLVYDGSARIKFTAQPGGRGVLRRKPRPPVVHIYEPSLYRADAQKFTKSVESDTEVKFVDGKKYKFITTLYKPKPKVDKSKTFLRSLPKKTPVVYAYESDTVLPKAKKIQPAGSVEFYDHVSFINEVSDDELIVCELYDNPLCDITVELDYKHTKLMHDDNLLLMKLL